jgi:hypothetical protein
MLGGSPDKSFRFAYGFSESAVAEHLMINANGIFALFKFDLFESSFFVLKNLIIIALR